MNIALITASGVGSRMNLDKPKQFVLIDNKPLLVYTIEAFNNHKDIDAIFIVTNKEYINEVKSWINTYKLNKVKSIVEGGQTRQISVFNGLKEIKLHNYKDNDNVLIHDGARPLVDSTIITNNINGLKDHNAVVTCLPSSDTILLSADKDKLDGLLNRDEIFQEQTPASFKFKIIYEAHAKETNDNNSTDDCRLVLKNGTPIHIVKGSRFNFKITTIEDLKLLELLIKKED